VSATDRDSIAIPMRRIDLLRTIAIQKQKTRLANQAGFFVRTD
jgi:hypothetical protein